MVINWAVEAISHGRTVRSLLMQNLTFESVTAEAASTLPVNKLS
ncbi:hypothetical protein B0G81_8145 [Paraburkholderia sp. BL6665CI2N2]|nr:hypothetical protein B0G81_8145 [Paraburkholderia sp. BL6665CI2N2]